MMALLAMLAAIAGFTGLCLAMPRHHRQIHWRVPRPSTLAWLRVIGAAGVAVSLLFCGLAWGWGIGPVAWLGLLTLAGLAVIFLLLPAAAKLTAKA